MKVMTYNIMSGGHGRIGLILEVVQKESPDFLTINEAVGFEKTGVLEHVSSVARLPHFRLACSEKYHVAILSRFPFKNIKVIKPLMRAGIIAEVETGLGDIAIVGVHLTPYTEDQRIREINCILEQLDTYELAVLMGDMNSLAQSDGYSDDIVATFTEVQLKKFTSDGRLRFDIINRILSRGYIDTAVSFGKHQQRTAPTSLNESGEHANMRLDYIFASKTLGRRVSSYTVVANPVSDKASDHYPVTVVIDTTP